MKITLAIKMKLTLYKNQKSTWLLYFKPQFRGDMVN